MILLDLSSEQTHGSAIGRNEPHQNALVLCKLGVSGNEPEKAANQVSCTPEFTESRSSAISNPSYYLIRTILTLCSWLPLPVLHGIGWIWGSLMFLFPNKAQNTTRKNIITCFPTMAANKVEQLTRKSLINTACTALEMGKAWLSPISKTLRLVVSSEGYDEYRADVEGERGVILLAPHLSNWEIFGFFASEGLSANFMYQPPRSKGLDQLLRQVRARNGVNMAPTNKRGVAQLLAALKQGEMVGILPDQVPADESGIFVPFFDEPALTMTLVSKLVQRTGAKVYCGYARRLAKGAGFHAIFKEADPAIYSKELEESVRGLSSTIEDAVEGAVSQYQWEYKRFRRRPDNSEFYRLS